MPPEGSLCFVFAEDEAVAWYGIRKWEGEICELKRMYIRKAYRGQGLGKRLLIKSIGKAQELGYRKIRLDTLP